MTKLFPFFCLWVLMYQDIMLEMLQPSCSNGELFDGLAKGARVKDGMSLVFQRHP